MSKTYQWLRDGSAIHGATGTAYTETSADKKTGLSVRVTASLSAAAPGRGQQNLRSRLLRWVSRSSARP
ncbi:hypothetical protein [Actinacidiphila sp. ITFR-21]|uniref:hypothetical protein n=1 Tax=Actinacidiphila sp. ITFR-21 TaxID=3075199 RepID=UPI00288B9984|nr:hypothetical protein [Streptomyces sp. ITFR-21]WNI18038.1 hypothetical protein RLT57_22460 [Streptomyces sp. ITFR-21]